MSDNRKYFQWNKSALLDECIDLSNENEKLREALVNEKNMHILKSNNSAVERIEKVLQTLK